MKIWFIKTNMLNEYYVIANDLKTVMQKYEKKHDKEIDEEIVEIKVLVSGVIYE